MHYTLTIQADGAAFDDDWDGLAEVSRILRATAQRLANEPPPLTLKDFNGNTVGSLTFTEE